MRRLGVALCAVAILVTLPIARAETEKDAHSAIQARYDEFNRAYMKKDFKAVAAVFDPECSVTFKNGKKSIKSAVLVQSMQAVSSRLTVSHATTRIVSIKADGDAYVVAAVWTGDSSYVPPLGSKDDPPRSSKTEQSVSDTWKKSGKGWRIVQRIIEGADPD
jgi:ketosteroid isomerase-like protein